MSFQLDSRLGTPGGESACFTSRELKGYEEQELVLERGKRCVIVPVE